MTRAFLPTLLEEVFNDDAFPLIRKVPSACAKGSCGVSLYEDENAIYLEAPVPGIKPEDVKIFYDKGGLSIEAESKEEKKEVKYHYKAASNFSYWVPLPAGKVDENASPEAVCKDGILKVTFTKSRASKPLKISVKGA